MSIFEQYETDLVKESEGAEVTLAPNNDGSVPTFILAATSRNNQKYNVALEKAVKPFKNNLKDLPNEKAFDLYLKVFIDTVLKGWRNIQDKNGQGIPYSKETAYELFKKLPRLYDKLTADAADIETFKEAVREEAAGN